MSVRVATIKRPCVVCLLGYPSNCSSLSVVHYRQQSINAHYNPIQRHNLTQMKIESSETAKNTFNPIRSIVDKLKPPPASASAKKLISLSLGDPTVFGNLHTATEVRAAMVKAIEGSGADGYAASVGMEMAREAIAERYKKRFEVNYDAKDIVITSGCSGALDLAISVLCGPQDCLLIPQPGFTLYATLCTSKGIDAVTYPLDENAKWQIKLDEVEKILLERGEAIKAWLINNPSNPCGSVYSKNHLISCLKLARKFNVPIIADEIYEDMVFEGSEYIPLSLLCQQSTDFAVPILTCSGLSKRFLIPGWRFGWIAIGEYGGYDLTSIRQGLFDLSTLIIGSCTLIQAALPEIIKSTPESFYKSINRVLQENAKYLSEELGKIEGIKVIEPQGTMYMLIGIETDKFAFSINQSEDVDVIVSQMLLSEQYISVLPGSIFGIKGFIRLVYSAPMDILKEFIERMREFFDGKRRM